MRQKRYPLLATFILVGCLTILSQSFAQEAATTVDPAQAPPTKIAIINPLLVLEAHPQGQAVKEAATALQGRYEADLAPIAQELTALQQKARSGQELTAEEQSQADLLSRTLQETQARYNEELAAVYAPVEDDIGAAIRAVAQQYGFTMVMDYTRLGLGGLGIVVYAEGTPDITELVIQQLQAQ